MPVPFQHKRSSTPGATPTLLAGELAFNLADKRVFTANSSVVFDALQATSSNLTITNSVLTVGNTTVNVVVNSTVIVVGGVPVYPNLPQVSQSTAYTTVLLDANKHILHPSADNNARTFTIANNSSVAYPIGTAITFVNQANVLTIAIETDTMVLAANGAAGNRTLANNGIATALKITSTSWLISGAGLT